MLTISLRLRSATTWAEAFHEIAWWQHSLPSSQGNSTIQPRFQVTDKLLVSESRVSVKISNTSNSWHLDRITGYVTSWISSGLTLVEPDQTTGAALIPSFWRAPTDNDMPGTLPYWRRFGLDAMTSRLKSLTITADDTTASVEVNVETSLSPPILSWGYNVKSTYTFYSNGAWKVNVHMLPHGPHPDTIPRVGLDLHLPRSLDQVSWLGPGPGESYPDKRNSQRVSIWSKSVSELHTNYDHPQENGNRMDTRWIAIVNSYGAGIRVTGERYSNGQSPKETFHWSAGQYSANALEAAKHPCDLITESATLVKLNAEVAGVGSAACGPGVAEEFEVKCCETEFSFILEPTQI